LENAIALVSGAVHGPMFITKSFARQEDKVEDQTPIDRDRVVQVLNNVFDVFLQADQLFPVANRNTARSQWAVGKYLGAILYDILMNPNTVSQVQKKWATYLSNLRRGEEGASEAYIVAGANNITSDKLKRICTKVDTYLSTGRIMTKEELDRIRHPAQTDSDEETSDEESDSEDDE